MIPFLFSCFLAADFLGIDLGAQFYKLAYSTYNGQVEIYTNPISNSVINPSAAALKFHKPHSPPYSADDFSDIELRITGAASQLIKRNASVGYEFLPSMIRRNHSTFNRSTAITPEELFPIFIHRAINSLPKFQKVSIALPSMFSRKQFQFIAAAFEMVNLKIGSIVDDMTSVFLLYSSIRAGRFMKEPKHVLFVDVGASMTRAYSGIYTYVKTPSEHSVINQTSYEFSEKVSGIEFAKELAKKTNVTFNKAMKTLIRTRGEGRETIMEKKMEELVDFLRDVVNSAEKNANGKPIDEVQIIGGASTFKFVADTIRIGTNHSIRRDFNANEAVAMGAVVAAMIMNEASAFLPVSFVKKPTMTMNATCGNVTKEYCKRGANCTNILEFDSSCEDIFFTAEKNDIIDGISETIAHYNINQTLPNNATIRLFVQEPDAAIQEAQYCINESCEPLYQIIDVDDRANDTTSAYSFMTNFMLSISKKLMEIRIENLLDKLTAYIAKLEANKKIEATYTPTEEMKKSVGMYQVLRNGGGLSVMNITETNDALSILADIANKLHVKVE